MRAGVAAATCVRNITLICVSPLPNLRQTVHKRTAYKIACGPNIDDYNWMDVLMKHAAPFMDGISLHHYALASMGR